MKHYNDDGTPTQEFIDLASRGQHTWQYKMLAKEAARLGWPRMWDTDLTMHDAASFAQRKPDDFLWAIRETGTDLHIDLDDENDATWRRAEVHNWGHKAKFYHVTRSGAREIKPGHYVSWRKKA